LTQREKFDIFRGNFPNPYPNRRWLTQPELLKIDPDPSLPESGIGTIIWPFDLLSRRPGFDSLPGQKNITEKDD